MISHTIIEAAIEVHRTFESSVLLEKEGSRLVNGLFGSNHCVFAFPCLVVLLIGKSKIEQFMMSIDWLSSKNTILINPRFSKNEKLEILKMLDGAPYIQDHFWIATSGSTGHSQGRVKWTALSKEAILSSAQAVNDFLFSTHSDIWLNPLPYFHVGGLGIFARAYLNHAKVIDAYTLMQKWNPLMYYELLSEHKVTLSSLVPAQLFDLVVLEKKSPPNLRALIVGGGALSEGLYTKATYLGWKILPSYGLTECASQVATALLKQSPLSFPKLTLLPHIKASINSKGFILLKSPSLLSMYAIKNEKNNIQYIDPKVNGWFETEDLGEIDEKILTIKGRKSYFIKIGGESVDLLRLERILNEIKISHNCVFDMALVAMPHDRLGFIVNLAIAGKPNCSLDTIVQEYQKAVLPFEKIRTLYYINAIPRNELGKLIMNDLVNFLCLKKHLSHDI